MTGAGLGLLLVTAGDEMTLSCLCGAGDGKLPLGVKLEEEACLCVGYQLAPSPLGHPREAAHSEPSDASSIAAKNAEQPRQALRGKRAALVPRR